MAVKIRNTNSSIQNDLNKFNVLAVDCLTKTVQYDFSCQYFVLLSNVYFINRSHFTIYSQHSYDRTAHIWFSVKMRKIKCVSMHSILTRNTYIPIWE